MPRNNNQMVPYTGRRSTQAMGIISNLINGAYSAPASRAATKAAEAVMAGGLLSEAGKLASKALKKPKKSLRGSQGMSSREAPTSFGTKITSAKPMSSKSVSGGVRVQNRELLNGSVLGSTSFSVTDSYNVNPGLASSFPWLSIQAAQYEQYKIHSLRFIFVPSVSTSSIGDVMIMHDYNSQDPPPTMEVQFLDHPGAIISSVWESVTFQSNAREMLIPGPKKFVRAVATAGDIKTYDGGCVYIASNNCAGSTAIGKLFVEYDVEFYIPQLTPPVNNPEITFMAYNTSIQTITTAVPTNILLSSPLFDPLGFSSGYNAGTGVFTPPAGTYRIEAYYNGANSGTAATNYQIQFQKRGADIPATLGPQATTTTGSRCQVSQSLVVVFDGTETFSVQAIISGAGTLTIPAYAANLMVSVA